MADRTGLFVAPLPGTPPVGTSPTDGRLVLGALFGTGPGCISGGGFTASGTAMQVTVAAAVWRIPDPTNAAGVYLSPADAALLTFSAGPASGSRIDVLWVRQNNYEAGDANSRVVYGVTAGVAASSPVAPAVPAGAMKIGQLTVPTGVGNAAACVLVASPTSAGRAPLLDVHPGMRCSIWKGGSQSLPGSTVTAVGFDSIQSDPTGLMAPLDGYNVRLPWSGRYRASVRWGFTGSDSAYAQTEFYLNGSTSISITGRSAPSGLPLGDTIEFGATAGSRVGVAVYTTGAEGRSFAIGDDRVRPKLEVQYLGPA